MSNSFSPPSGYTDPSGEEMPILPASLWSHAYLNAPGVLALAVRIDSLRVAKIYAEASTSTSTPPVATPPPTQTPTVVHRPSAPSITPFDGESANLRFFCSQLQNQFLDQADCFPNEGSKVRYAYRCLGPASLSKTRTSFRCYEDPTIPSEINTIDQFYDALRQLCQDPGLTERASRTVETLYQRDMKFHDFISLFEDNLADSTYASHDKSQWKTMLERRLSKELRTLLNSASDVPTEYHELVNYLRKKDANIQVINAPLQGPYRPRQSATPASSTPYISRRPASPELTVSQGGSGMDLDTVSQQRQPGGRLTQQAKDARRLLGRCIRCNRSGHATPNCPLPTRNLARGDVQVEDQEQLKD